MNEYEFRRLLLAALGSTGGFQNEVEFRYSLVTAMAAITAGTFTDTKARNAIKTKTEIAALTGASTAADIVTALKA